MADGMNVLSLCDGMSCGHIALDEVGIKVNKYFAAEIKDVAIRVTTENYPDTIEIGDVNKITYSDGVLHTEVGDFEERFDLVIFGSPCQSNSRCMKKDKRIGLEDATKSGLFYECNRILKEVNPEYFLMENVVMDKDSEKIISEMMGVSPMRINSKLLTAQMRDRLYWTNIPNVTVPEDKGIKVNDILSEGYYPYDKARCLLRNDSHGYYNGCNRTWVKCFYRWYYKSFGTILQGVPVDYVKNLSEKEAADVLGDGWTVPVIAHLFKGLVK